MSCLCFDKTGTLTKDKLDFAGVVLSSQLGSESGENCSVSVQMLKPGEVPDEIRKGMACCSGLALIETRSEEGADADGARQVKDLSTEQTPGIVLDKRRYQGLALDVAMFEASRYELYHDTDGQLSVRPKTMTKGVVGSGDVKLVVENVKPVVVPKDGFTLVERHAFDAELQRSSVIAAPQRRRGFINHAMRVGQGLGGSDQRAVR